MTQASDDILVLTRLAHVLEQKITRGLHMGWRVDMERAELAAVKRAIERLEREASVRR